jgi:hypothetical protein
MQQFKRLNSLLGWLTFLIALTTYVLTLEPTASWWDCGEFISTAYKLQVGHPPGAPLFMILGRFFSLFAPDVTKVAYMINLMSALASAFTILFLFWSITHLARKITISNEKYTSGKTWAIMGAGLVGALAYTFSDTFWFSAVEAEVYATSSLFTAVVFWAILKWEDAAHERFANRWLILIAYLMGLSIGVHLLNLLAIPAMVLVYYFKKYKPTTKGIIYALIISLVLLGCVMYIVVNGVINLSSYFELFFVNSLGMPYNSGVLFYALLLIGLLVLGIYFTHKKKKVLLNTILLAFTVMIIGYSSYAMIVIRSQANPSINENNPRNVFSLMYYLSREQYGDRPLIKGEYYCAYQGRYEFKQTSPVYSQIDGRYEVTSHHSKIEFDEKLEGFFPRMYSPDPDHINVYKSWADIKGRKVRTENSKGENIRIIKPTFFENIKFFVSYQVGFMYFRYFMWNFSGRQNDEQSYGGPLRGNWITGIPFLDNLMLGSQNNLPPSMKENKGRNAYYLLPFIVGLLGMFFHFGRSRKDFSVVMLLFLLTGLAIVVYLNQTPNQPRERDYAYAGSFYAFAIWIGLGVLSLFHFFNKKIKELPSALIATVILLFAVPCIMARANWDDHDRSGRYTVRDIAANYLNSCAPNAILFTNGDNDTFPLWYAQEVEGIRRDVRIVNLMLLNMDWYIDQMRRRFYESDPIPITIDSIKYREGTRDEVYVISQDKAAYDLKQAVDFVASDADSTKYDYDGEKLAILKGNHFRLKVDKEIVLANGTVKKANENAIVPFIEWDFKASRLTKSDLILLDIIANNQWKRPIYFASTGHEGCADLDDYLQLDGIAYRLIPVKTKAQGFYGTGRIDTDILYNNLMNKFHWGRMEQPDVWMDHFNQRNLLVTKMRSDYPRLADSLLAEGKRDSAIKVLNRIVGITPKNQIPYDKFTLAIVEAYFRAGEVEKAKAIMNDFSNICLGQLSYYFAQRGDILVKIGYDIDQSMQSLEYMLAIAQSFKQNDFVAKVKPDFDKFVQKQKKLYGDK